MNYRFEFSEKKDLWLRQHRNVSFQEVIEAINRGDIITVIDTPDQAKHPNQRMYILDINGYRHAVPFDIDKSDPDKILLRTIYKSRKLQKRHKKKEGV